MASGFAVVDVRDLCDAEELKIKSSYSSSLKDTIEKLCSGERCDIFEKCFQEVKESVARIRAKSSASKEHAASFPKYVLVFGSRITRSIKENGYA